MDCSKRGLVFLWVIIVIAVAGAVFLYAASGIFQIQSRLAEVAKKPDKLVVEEVKKEVVSPTPLRQERSAPVAFLSQPGVLRATNIERDRAGLPKLAESSNLDGAAVLKLGDMFAKEYFAHVSPDGIDAADLAERAGYEFIAIGENLALGNFENDEALVRAWMESPGHRANILSSKYQEIGVAVGKGRFEGKTTWLAVQIFAKPLSACPRPSSALKSAIESSEQQLIKIEQELTALRKDIETSHSQRGEEFNAKVESYNSLVAQYNELVSRTQALIAEYNAAIKRAIACVNE